METCKLCGHSVDSLYHEAEEIVIKMIKSKNPEWIEPDGSCQKCLEHYQNLDDMVQVEEPEPSKSNEEGYENQ